MPSGSKYHLPLSIHTCPAATFAARRWHTLLLLCPVNTGSRSTAEGQAPGALVKVVIALTVWRGQADSGRASIRASQPFTMDDDVQQVDYACWTALPLQILWSLVSVVVALSELDNASLAAVNPAAPVSNA